MPNPRTLWLVRHGNRLDFTNPEWLTTAARPHDPPLSPDGVIQARQTGQRLKSETIDHVFASPFVRATETASYIAEAIDRPIRIEHGLCEAFYPNWFPFHPDFPPTAELARAFPQIDLAYESAVTPAYPETAELLRERVTATATALLNRFEGNLLWVAHGGSIAAMSSALLSPGGVGRCSVHTPCCCLIKLVGNPGEWALEADGRDTSHLSHSETAIRLA